MIDEDEAWIDYRSRFADVYDEANYASPVQARVMRKSHWMLEKPFGVSDNFQRIVEIGAGTGEHISFVRHRFDSYTLTDLDPKTLDVAKAKLGREFAGKVFFEAQAGEGLSYDDNTFDRLIASHVLEHIYRPHLAIKEWRRVVRNGGTLSILIPTDPGMAWRLGRHLGPRRDAIAQGIAYDYVMAREHVNSCNNLIALLRHYFPERKEAWWPLPIPSIDFNLFFAAHVVVKK